MLKPFNTYNFDDQLSIRILVTGAVAFPNGTGLSVLSNRVSYYKFPLYYRREKVSQTLELKPE